MDHFSKYKKEKVMDNFHLISITVFIVILSLLCFLKASYAKLFSISAISVLFIPVIAEMITKMTLKPCDASIAMIIYASCYAITTMAYFTGRRHEQEYAKKPCTEPCDDCKCNV